ncbi:LemA family protein [Candidatus Saccharibacteria bacterium 32-50-13]|nr:MAG: LemA family protein [Candidatus Saccharibacteria bacterium 32-50-13]
MNRKWLIPAVIIGAVLLLGGVLIGSYNGLIGQRESVRKSLSNLDSQYQRRADLIPNLVSTVKGAADFEQETLTEVVEARSRATSVTIDPDTASPEQIAAYQESQGELSQALGRLLAVAESYPQLTATENFRDLQVQLEGTENRINVARRDFNEVASSFNSRVQTFPTNILAGLFGFDQFPYFEAAEGSDEAPTVDFE